ncbi:Protein of unknown function [Bacillus mycoides]|uniref:Uncharacterized protein n=1 Tax=Bacillus mycoides TaxID=1405 RepID=A0A1G4ENX2_BACMY|nr:Protein of unknown function [Bacillus mycoides]
MILNDLSVRIALETLLLARKSTMLQYWHLL